MTCKVDSLALPGPGPGPRPATTLCPSSVPPPPSIHLATSPSHHLAISPSRHPSIPLPPSQPPTLACSLSLSLLPALLGPGQRLLGNPRARHAATFSFMFTGPAQSHLCTHPGWCQPGSEWRYCDTLEGPVAGVGGITASESCTQQTGHCRLTVEATVNRQEPPGPLEATGDVGLVFEYPRTSRLLIT